MKRNYEIVVFLCVALLGMPVECGSNRRRRSLFDMWQMIAVETGMPPRKFWPYGRYCGMGGIGDPVDNIDKCCKHHDLCYGKAEKYQCTEEDGEIYVINYKWYVSKGKKVKCGRNKDVCAKISCNCDRKLAVCFRKNMKEYNPEYHPNSFLSYLPKFGGKA